MSPRLGYCLAAAVMVLGICVKICQGIHWVEDAGDVYNQPCSSSPLNFTWMYTPAQPDPTLVEWSKENDAGTFFSIATLVGGNFTITTKSYEGRLFRLDNTAQIGLRNPTPADAGRYRVSVVGPGNPPLRFANVINVVPASKLSGICINQTVTCSTTDLGTPPATITLSSKESTKSNTNGTATVSVHTKYRQDVQCKISGPAVDCMQGIKTLSFTCGPKQRLTEVIVCGALMALLLASVIAFLLGVYKCDLSKGVQKRLYILVAVLSLACLIGWICLITVLAIPCPLGAANCKWNLAMSVLAGLAGVAGLGFSRRYQRQLRST